MLNFILHRFGFDHKYQEIHEGYSDDKKYLVSRNRKNFLLKQINVEKRHETTVQIEVAEQCSSYHLPVQRLAEVYLGIEYDYLLYEWIEGQNLHEALGKLDEDTGYQLGVEAGKIHKAVHDMPCAREIDWVTFFNKKIDRKLDIYKTSPLRYPNDQLLLSAVDENRSLLTNTRTSYLHGDFHALNMVLDKNQKISVIDLNRAECGDPYEEFLRITWDVERCAPFAKGRLDGYFEYSVPNDFWPLLKLYICSDLLTLLPWSATISENQVNIALNKYNKVLSDYDNFKRAVPKWFK